MCECLEQGLLDSSDGAGVPLLEGSEAAAEAGAVVAMNELEPVPASDVYGAGAEWLQWTQFVPQDESLAKCWTEIIDVEQDDGPVSRLLWNRLLVPPSFLFYSFLFSAP